MPDPITIEAFGRKKVLSIPALPIRAHRHACHAILRNDLRFHHSVIGLGTHPAPGRYAASWRLLERTFRAGTPGTYTYAR
jgi:hypothetical protein